MNQLVITASIILVLIAGGLWAYKGKIEAEREIKVYEQATEHFSNALYALGNDYAKNREAIPKPIREWNAAKAEQLAKKSPDDLVKRLNADADSVLRDLEQQTRRFAGIAETSADRVVPGAEPPSDNNR